MKLVTVIGARPQFIKASALSRAIHDSNLNSSKKIEEIIIHSGQHYDSRMSSVFFGELEIPQPRFNLEVGSGTRAQQLSLILQKLEPVLLELKPDAVLVYGDTNTTLGAALTASSLNIPLIHVEAGFRSFNRQMVEEENRVLTDQIADILFCPTENACQNLFKEGLAQEKLSIASAEFPLSLNVGDIMFDAFLNGVNQLKQKGSSFAKSLKQEKRIGNYGLVTLHRPQNTDDKPKRSQIFQALNEIAKDSCLIFPVHPRLKKIIQRIDFNSNIHFIEPVSYLEMLSLQKDASFIITDSGGIQKEAFFQKKHCLTLRDDTEVPETVHSGWNTLVEQKFESIISAYHELNANKAYFTDSKLFGDGAAGKKIVETLLKVFT